MSEAEKLDISDWGVRRFVRRGGRTQEEALAWTDLRRVDVTTTDAGPLAEDMFFVLLGADRTIVVSNERAVESGLLTAMQERLHGLDNEAVIAASARTDPSRVTIWERRA